MCFYLIIALIYCSIYFSSHSKQAINQTTFGKLFPRRVFMGRTWNPSRLIFVTMLNHDAIIRRKNISSFPVDVYCHFESLRIFQTRYRSQHPLTLWRMLWRDVFSRSLFEVKTREIINIRKGEFARRIKLFKSLPCGRQFTTFVEIPIAFLCVASFNRKLLHQSYLFSEVMSVKCHPAELYISSDILIKTSKVSRLYVRKFELDHLFLCSLFMSPSCF